MKDHNIVILGTVGVPANYGGFESLAENLVKYHDATSLKSSITVYCSSKSYSSKKINYLSARLKYIPISANGAQSIPYDILSLVSAVWHRSEVILLLGVSGAIALPLVRFISTAKIVTNIDGIEWRRAKWKGLARHYLRLSERIAVRFSHEIIADNASIAEYIDHQYSVKAHVIAYGGDHAVAVSEVNIDEYSLPDVYAFSVCRIEPENNVHLILEAFSQLKISLVLVGNWDKSQYGRDLRDTFTRFGNLILLNQIYDLGKLKSLRSRSSYYLHGHSAGGTNPSLVEAMHFGKPILAFDCNFNRHTTENKALFFKTTDDLVKLLGSISHSQAIEVGVAMLEIANRRYTWKVVAKQYFDLLCD